MLVTGTWIRCMQTGNAGAIWSGDGFASRVFAYRSIDGVDGTPNPWLQQWLPDYDSYWQGISYLIGRFANIHIPVLSITGYYDDGQLSALHYLRQLCGNYNRMQEHY